MAVALIDIILTHQRKKIEVVSDHYWYDQAKKQMVKVTGGSLAFRYAGNQMYVTTEPMFAVRYESGSNNTELGRWLEGHQEEFGLQVLDAGVHHIAVAFADEKKTAVEASLYQHRFEYEIMGEWQAKQLQDRPTKKERDALKRKRADAQS
jgi:hypothetical protein